MSIIFRGRPACTCLATWLPVYEAELLRRGVIKHSIDIYQLIGGSSKSAGTHINGGAYDIAQMSPTAIKIAREMGAAGFARPYNWDGDGGGAHQHGVLNGCPHNGPARYQIAALADGYNGLGRGGRGGRDTGPEPRRLRTWQQGIAWAKAQDTTRVTRARDLLTEVMRDNKPTSQRAARIRAALKILPTR